MPLLWRSLLRTQGHPLFRSHLTKEKTTAVFEHLKEGCGVRQTERLVGVHRDTVTRYTRKAGDHAVAATTGWSPSPPTTELQFVTVHGLDFDE